MSNGLKLGVNIDHVATLRQARGTVYPSPLEAARVCAEAGAHNITAHLREDRRHIQDADIYDLHKGLSLPLNLEMANHADIVKIALDIRPAEVCLVPEKREELTTEGGLDVAGHRQALGPVIQAMQEAGIMVSLFIEADPVQLDAAAELGAPCVELHTGAFCEAPAERQAALLALLIKGAEYAHTLNLQVNAGHGITLDNLPHILEMPHLHTLNIGHSIVSRAVFVGLEQAVKEMLTAMSAYAKG